MIFNLGEYESVGNCWIALDLKLTIQHFLIDLSLNTSKKEFKNFLRQKGRIILRQQFIQHKQMI